MPFTSDPGAYSPPPHICQSGIFGYITHWPFLGERPWLRENECDGEDLKQCKQHLCFLVVMAPALGRDGGYCCARGRSVVLPRKSKSGKIDCGLKVTR